MNRDFLRCFHDLLHSTKGMLSEELKRDIFVNSLRPEVYVRVLKMGVKTCESIIAKCMAPKAIEI